MKSEITLNQKQVARVIATAKRISLYNAIKLLEDEGVGKYKYLFPEFKNIEYVGFLQYKLTR
jgi:hypothetical protein